MLATSERTGHERGGSGGNAAPTAVQRPGRQAGPKSPTVASLDAAPDVALAPPGTAATGVPTTSRTSVVTCSRRIPPARRDRRPSPITVHTKRLMRPHPPFPDARLMKHEMVIDTSAARPAVVGATRDAAVLATLILVAAVASLNLSVANVALPTIGRAFNAGETTMDLVAVGYTFGLTASVLWRGALSDRYGQKQMLLAGTTLTFLASLLAAFAPTVQVLILARLLGGLSAGMALPTTLALVTELWSGETGVRYVKLWLGVSGAAVALGPAVSGLLLEHFAWGSVFLATVPLAVVALVLTLWLVPNHNKEAADAADSSGGALSVVLLGALALLEYADLMALVCHVHVLG